MSGVLDGSLALVTGAAQGVGEVAALRLARDGALVAVNDRIDTPALQDVVARTGGLAAPADVSSFTETRAMVERVTAEAGRPIDVLVANAAVETMGDFLEQSDEDFWRQVDVNLTGTIALIQAVLPGMRELGHGRIVIMSSIWGITGYPRAVGYAASKAGTISLTKALARELGPEGIRVNAIAPGVIDSPQIAVDAEDAGMTLDELRDFYRARTPVNRLGQPEEFASLISHLARRDTTPFAGQVIQPNGGSEVAWA